MPSLPTASSQGFNVRRAHRAFDRLLHARLAPHGIKTGYWYFLRILWNDDHRSQKYLSEATNVAENTTTALIAAMVRDGLVTRRRDPRDGRSWIVSLTPRAIAVRELLLPHAMEVNRIAEAGIDAADLATCLRVLQKMAGSLEQALSVARHGGQETDMARV